MSAPARVRFNADGKRVEWYIRFNRGRRLWSVYRWERHAKVQCSWVEWDDALDYILEQLRVEWAAANPMMARMKARQEIDEDTPRAVVTIRDMLRAEHGWTPASIAAAHCAAQQPSLADWQLVVEGEARWQRIHARTA